MATTKATKQLGDLTFVAINEEYRVYTFSGGSTLRIEQPRWLHVKNKEKGDSHRVIDADGVSHYVHPGWLAVSFKAPEGEEFSF